MQHQVSAYNCELQYREYKATINNYMIKKKKYFQLKAGMLIAYM